MNDFMSWKSRIAWFGGACLLLGMGCGGSDVKLIDAPPVTQSAPEKPKPNNRIPKGATFSPAAPNDSGTK